MKFFNLMKIVWRVLICNKTRALLTMLGIIIGIGSAQIVCGVQNWQGTIRGVNEAYMEINKCEIASGTDDFDVCTQKQMLEIMDPVMSVLTILLSAVASISLLVDGIGIKWTIPNS